MQIDRTEVLRYLGHRGGALDARVQAQLDQAETLISDAAKPRCTHAVYALLRGDTLTVAGTVLTLDGADIRKHLGGSETCILMAATLGAGVDAEIRRAQATDMGLAAILDAAATAAIEWVCDDYQTRLAEQYGYLTDRFSPGYGDLPLSLQGPFCAVLDTARRIGLQATERSLLVPGKSVTAIIGILTRPTKRRSGGCDTCALRETCAYRKAGTFCD